MDATIGSAIVASVINSSSLNGRTNCSSSSSSSSSGYGSGHSAASTPATPISSHYDTSTHATITSVSLVSSAEQLPTATVAPVMPFYSENSIGQQQRQQYYQSYPYTNSSAEYNPVYDAYTGNSYHNLTTPSVERSIAIGIGRHSNNSSTGTSVQRSEKQYKPLSVYSTGGTGTQHYGTSSTTALTVTTCSTTKPQATATPFFAQSSANVNTTAATFYDAYGKYKIPSTTKLTTQTVPDYTANYTNHIQHAAAAASLSYQQQQQHYYAAAKSQLQDVNYVAAVVKPHRQHNISNSTTYYNSGSAYYDKYMYGPSGNAATYSAVPTHAPPQHSYPQHEPSSADPYRSNRISAPWQMEYGIPTAGNCRNLQPAANSGNYLVTSGTSGNGRDSFCAAAVDKYGKYDKYSAYYGSPHHPQQFISPSPHSAMSGPPSTARSLWHSTPHHTPHLAPIPAVINERLHHSSSVPTHQYPHAHTHSNTHHPFGPAANTTTQRTQSCCTQPFQQQSCYYPRATQQYPHVAVASAYQPTQPTQYATVTGHSGGSAHKYSTYPSSTYKSNNSNDIYLSSPFDPPPTAHNYSGPTTATMTQRYGGMGASNSAFYNDLNVQPAFESNSSNTHAMSQPSVLSQHVSGAHSTHHLTYQTFDTSQNSADTPGLLEYRKPMSVAEVAVESDCCLTTTHIPLSNLDQHVADQPSYLSYDIHGNPISQAHTVITSPSIYSDGNCNSEKSTSTTKNLSLRDFLSTWNEEEEEDINNTSEQLSFIEEATKNSKYIPDSGSEMVAISSTTTSVHQNRLQLQQTQPNSSEQQFQEYKNTYQEHPKIHVGITVDGSMDVEASQYINLPDIVIDIEKPNNAGTTIAQTGSGSSTAATVEHHHSPCGANELFENFDVEKELDALQIKRAKMCLEKQLNNEIRILTPEPIKSLSQELVGNVPSKDIVKNVEVEPNHNTTAIENIECVKSFDNNDNFLNEIELNDNNSHSSNSSSSTFEKEYETFINRIELDKVCEQHESQQRNVPVKATHHSSFINDYSESVSHLSSDIKTPPDPIVYEEMTINECTQNQDFINFYKKKRKLMKDENEEEIKTEVPKQFNSEIKTSNELTTKNIGAMEKPTSEILTSVDLQKPYAWKSISANLKRRRRNLSQFYKILKRRRSRADTTALVQKHIAMLKERHLPLIKRQSFKNYSSCNKALFNPRSLLHLTVTLVNSPAFQEILLLEKRKILKNCSENYDKGHKDCQKTHTKDISNRMENINNVENNIKKVEMTPNSTTVVEDESFKNDHSLDKATVKFKESLEEPNSSSNSANGSTSLKEQDDFNGFEEHKISENHSAENNILHHFEIKKSAKPEYGKQQLSKHQEESSQSQTLMEVTTNEFINMAESRIPSVETYKTNEMLRSESFSEEEKPEYNQRNLEKFKRDEDDSALPPGLNNDLTENSEKVRDGLKCVSKTVGNKFQNSNYSNNIRKNANSISATQVSSAKEGILSNATNEIFKEKYNDYDKSKDFWISCTQPSENITSQMQTLPAMRTKASVKMCDFPNVQGDLTSTKTSSNSKSPISDKSSKSKFKFQNSSNFLLNCVEKVDRAKFVKKWAESTGATSTMNFQAIPTIEDPNPEVLDLSSRNPEKSEHFNIVEDSNSSVTMSSSSSSTSSKTCNKSSTSSSSSSTSTSTSSSSSNPKNSSIAIHRREPISTDGSEFNELKALERELSHHKPLSDTEWKQKKTVKISEAENSQDLNKFDIKKTDSCNLVKSETKAQDIAELKKILESEQDEATIKNTLQCETSNHGLMDPKEFPELISTNQKPESLKNITKAFLDKEALIFNYNRESENLKYQKYHNQQHVHQQKKHDAIPKLSDLCEIALNGSFDITNIICKEKEKNILNVVMPVKNESIPPKSQVAVAEATGATTKRSNSTSIFHTEEPCEKHEQERELTVEEALAEMYRQAGVLSDAEDVEDDLHPSDNGENRAQDFLLIDLAEILESSENENNVFLLQCDMNENLLSVMTATQNTTTVPSYESSNDHRDVNRINPFQIVELLTTNDYELISDSNAEPALLPGNDVVNTDSIVTDAEDSHSAISELPIIHHEEIVPDNYKEFANKQFLKYLHEKYVQKNVKKFHHANRILKKYRRQFLIKKTMNYLEATQCSPM